MKRIMFVCHGNICRSPMAEFVFKEMINQRGISSDFYVSSSATSTEEIGNPVYAPARAELAKHGINCDCKRSVQLVRSDYDKYDLFVGMDSANIRNMLRIFGSDPEGKVSRLLDYTGQGRDVADPWYTGIFDVTYSDVRDGCTALLKSILGDKEII